MKSSRVIFVGQGPSQNGDPLKPLEGQLGEKLAQLLDLRFEDYVDEYARINLNAEWIGKGSGKGDVFDATEGRATAKVLLRGSWTHYVLLGQKVAECFGPGGNPLDTIQKGEKSFFLLPHPSGINRWWNDPDNTRRASIRLRTFVIYG